MAQLAQLDPERDAPEWMAPPVPSVPPVSPFSLAAVRSSLQWQPLKAIIYGVPGVGKTTMAATFPAPILLKLEEGANALDIPCFPKVAENTKEVFDACTALQGPHDFKTLVIDSLDWLEPLMWESLCKSSGKKSIEDFGFGKGYVLLDQRWRQFCALLDSLRVKRGMNIVCICHASAVTVEPPDCDSYQTWSLKLHKRASAIWTEWADTILFLNYKKNIVTANDNGKGKAYGTGDRIVYTSGRPAYTAKSRWPLPPEVFIGQDVSWQAFHDALAEASNGAYNNGFTAE